MTNQPIIYIKIHKKKLLKSLETIFSDCKLVYSTHSHHLIHPQWLAGTYIVTNEAISYDSPENDLITETNINATLYRSFVSNHPNELDHFRPILDALDYAPSRLEMVPKVIFTEGKNDFYTLKYMAHITEQEGVCLNFYPGAGVDKLDDPFRLYLAWNKPFIAIFDADEAGKKAKSRYIYNIGPDVKEKIFTLKDIDEKWDNKKMEDLFYNDDRINCIKELFPDCSSYDKSKFNTSVQDLYIHKRDFTFSDTSKENFNKIFDFLKEKIDQAI